MIRTYNGNSLLELEELWAETLPEGSVSYEDMLAELDGHGGAGVAEEADRQLVSLTLPLSQAH
eukprot:12937397-Prorocentrum_lima.AAC.1